jgi:hypothetical protein
MTIDFLDSDVVVDCDYVGCDNRIYIYMPISFQSDELREKISENGWSVDFQDGDVHYCRECTNKRNLESKS